MRILLILCWVLLSSSLGAESSKVFKKETSSQTTSQPAEKPEPNESEPLKPENTTSLQPDEITKEKSKPSSPIKEALKQTQPKVEWSLTIGKVVWAAVWASFAFLFIKYLSNLLEAAAERWINLRLTLKRVIPFIRVIGWTLSIYFIIAGVLAPPIETLLALTASAGIALGFASQDILKNIFGGIMILIDRPFQVGDKIQVGSHYGEVIQIGLRSVRIITPDDSLVSIPNSDMVNQSVSNSNSGESNCQVVAEFFLPLCVDVDKVRKVAYRAAAVSRYAYLNKPIAIVFKNEIHQGQSMLKMRLKAYVLDIRYEFPFMSDMTELVVRTLVEKGLVQSQDVVTS